MSEAKPRIALWFRYGPAEHAELFHAMPQIVEALARHAEVHYFGLRSAKPLPELIRQHAVIHHLPFTVDRTSERDKVFKTILWLLCLPWVGLKCRRLGVSAVYIDETVPLSAFLARTFFGPRVAFTVADFFVDIYLDGSHTQRELARVIRHWDMAVWKRLPVIFTRAKSTKDFLAAHGVPRSRVFPVYDPCDFNTYHPVDKRAARAKLGYKPGEIVLVHHGILHPNKGNDWILQALADLRFSHPELRYLLIGDGPDMDRLKEIARKLEIEDRVVFTGWLKTLAEVNEALNAGDIGLVMRIGRQSDDFHVTGALVHSMACGLPILAARLGGVSEIIRDGENGYLFRPGIVAEFHEKLLKLAGDEELRQRFGRSALTLAHELFDMGRVTEQTVRPLLALAGVKEDG